MVVARTLLSLPHFFVVSLVAWLALGVSGQAQVRPRAVPLVPKQPPANPGAGVKAAAAEELRMKEANVLRKAVIVLAGANHDYDGHRVKAIHALLGGIKILDASVLKNGSPQQKELTATQDAAVKAALEAAKNTKKFHEPQPTSDAQLRQAATLLTEVRPELVKLRRKEVLEHVNKATNEIATALKIR